MSLVNINQINIIDSTGTASEGSVPIAVSGADNVWSSNWVGALLLPSGTTAEQPMSPIVGMIRFNTDNNRFEVYDGDWDNLGVLSEDMAPQLGGDLDVNGFSIISISNGDIALTPDGTGSIILDGLIWPSIDGTNGQVLTTDGSGNLSFTSLVSGVGSVFGRAGAVVAEAGDYDADQITVIPFNDITATDVQTVLEELKSDIDNLTASDISYTPGSITVSTDVQGAIDDLDSFASSIASTTANVDSVFGRTGVVIAVAGDYDADQITVIPFGDITATDVQTALEELKADIDAFVDTDNQTAAEVPFTPTGTLTSTDVQSAIEELDSTVAAIPTFGFFIGAFTISNLPSASDNFNNLAYATDILSLVYSDGADWIDTSDGMPV